MSLLYFSTIILYFVFYFIYLFFLLCSTIHVNGKMQINIVVVVACNVFRSKRVSKRSVLYFFFSTRGIFCFLATQINYRIQDDSK